MSVETIELNGREIEISNPDKIFFPELGATKLDLVNYFLSVAPGVLAGCFDRPMMLKRHPNGVEGDFFYQKRVPTSRPEWIETVVVSFPSGRTAEFLAIQDEAHLAWAINLGCMDLNPWPVRRPDVDHPDELRVDIDPTPNVPFADVRTVALLVKGVLEEYGLRGYPKTSGKRGMHVNVRIEPRWSFQEVRRAALALARRVEEEDPNLVTTAWWKELRHGVFIDYNQNARDRTVASAYSVRPTPDARVSCPLEWEEVAGVEPERLTLESVPKRFAEIGDPGATIDEQRGSIAPLLELADEQEASGAEEAPWPPHFAKQPGEKPRVAPSRRATPGKSKRAGGSRRSKKGEEG